ncbi:MAG: response regulator transcription factor, partial [Saprospiraceae bacterium]|nr:response regulator transcription factor [Saprospiraceae bacterium]
MARILLVEDESTLNDVIKLNLEMEEYEVVSCENGKDALSLFANQHFDLLVLDVMLPDLDGFQVCEQIRLTDHKTPIIFLTAKDHPKDRIKGLKIGGDDYINKPFELEELLLRVRNVLRRTSSEIGKSIQLFSFGPFWVNFQDYRAKTLKGEVDLSKTEVMLLKLLIDRRNKVVSRQEILQSVWGYDIFPSTRTIDNFILSFRKYFEANPRSPVYFKSVRGV